MLLEAFTLYDHSEYSNVKKQIYIRCFSLYTATEIDCHDKVTEGKVKVKCTLVQALKLCTGRTAHRGSRGIGLPFHDHGTRWV